MFGISVKSKYDDNKYIGFKSGKLTVVKVGLRSDKYAGAIWECKCSCNGNIKKYRASLIANRYTQSCGCETINVKSSKFNDKSYIGKIYGDLKVASISNEDKKGVYWTCECIHCRHITTRKAQDVYHNKITRCRNKQCLRDRNKTNIKYNKDEYIGKVYNLLKVEKYSIEEDETNNSDSVIWTCRCLNCGRVTKIRAALVVSGSYISCGCVHTSKHEIMLEHIFNKNNIQYKKEVSFDDLFGIRGGKLRFDFAIIDSRGNKKLIEYDGKQHFIEPVLTSTWNTEATLLNDVIKNDYCEKHNIELIRISKNFTNEDTFEEYLVKNKII